MTFPQIIGTIGLALFGAGLVVRAGLWVRGEIETRAGRFGIEPEWMSPVETTGNVLMYVGFALGWGWAWS